MIKTLTKLFIASFYKANTGFFLFFFFIFFGSVNGGTLISYHASLLTSILSSWVVLGGVFFFWALYQIKCSVFALRIINSPEGMFLYNMQAAPPKKQIAVYTFLQTSFYAPVLAYSIVAIGFGFKHGHSGPSLVIILFQLLVIACGTWVVYHRLNNWLAPKKTFDIGIHLPKPFATYLLFHFISQRKMVMVALKVLSVILLYVVLILNGGKADNDSFLLFYLVILLGHFIAPFFAVQFMENDLTIFRNLPLRKMDYAMAYLLCYCLLLLPELTYLVLYAQSLLSLPQILAYYGVAIASLFLLTAIQYSEAMDRDEYMKVGFALFFVSIFALHIQAFVAWISVQFVIGVILFWTGFYKYEAVE